MPPWRHRRQTTPVKPRQRRGKQKGRWAKEHLVLAFGLSAVVAVLSLLGFALYERQVATPGQPVAKVNGIALEARHLLQELRWTQLQTRTPQEIYSLLQPLVVSMENQELIRQEARKLGLTVSQTEIDQFIQAQFQKEADSEEAKRERAWARYQESLGQLELSDAQFRAQVEKGLWVGKLVQQLEAQLPKQAEQVYLHSIALGSLDLAEELRGQIAAGEDFATLAKANSLDAESSAQGGEVGWRPRGARPYLDEVAFSLELNQVSDPIPDPSGRFLLVKVTAKETRAIDEKALQEMKDNLLLSWITQAREGSKIEEYLTNNKGITWVLDQVIPR